MFLLQLEAGYKSSGIHLAAKVNLPFQFNYCGANSINICKSEVTSPKNAKRNALMIWNQQMLRSFLVQSPWLTFTSSLQAGPRWWSSGHNVRVKINRSWVWSSYQPVLYSCDPALQICMVLEHGDKVSFTCAAVGKNYLKRHTLGKTGPIRWIKSRYIGHGQYLDRRHIGSSWCLLVLVRILMLLRVKGTVSNLGPY